MSNSKSQHSKIIYRSTQGSSTSSSPPTAFAAANASLQNLSETQTAPANTAEELEAPVAAHSVEQMGAAPQVEAKVVPEVEATPKAIITVAAEADLFQPQEEVAPRTVRTDARNSGNVLPPQVVRDAKGHRGAKTRGRGKWKARPGVWFGAGAGALLLVAGGAAAGAYSNFASGETIAPNVSIAGVPVGGLTPSVAKARVLKHFGTPTLALLCDGKKLQMPIRKLGAKLSIEPTVKKAYLIGRDGSLPNNMLRVYGTGGSGKDFMLPIEWNKAQLVKTLGQLNSKIAIKPVDARLQAASVGLEVVPDRAGRELNLGAAAHLLQRKLYVGMPSIHLPSRSVEAKISARSLDGRDVQLASYTTSFNAGLTGRVANLRIACRAIENRVLMPGETFSFNASTGERTANKGYRMAHIFLRQPGAENSEVVDGLAGGVCQVSSTLFNAVRKTNLKADVNPIKIVERTSHSLPVTYVPRGLDATVAWPYKDFKFRNVTNHPVYVRTRLGRSKLSIAIWGRVPHV